jgi:hydrogenase-4 component F
LYGSKSLSKLSGLLRVSPLWGVALLAGSFAIAGSPPFGSFVSEWLLLRDTMAANEYLVTGVMLLGLTVTCIALTSHVSLVLFGRAPSGLRGKPRWSWVIMPGLLLLAALATSLAIIPPVMAFLSRLTAGVGVLP